MVFARHEHFPGLEIVPSNQFVTLVQPNSFLLLPDDKDTSPANMLHIFLQRAAV